jgi:hypothetical protein
MRSPKTLGVGPRNETTAAGKAVFKHLPSETRSVEHYGALAQVKSQSEKKGFIFLVAKQVWFL